MTATELRGGRYVLVKPLGEGTQGETFEAVDKREGRLVALKRFRVGKARAWKDVELAEREATTLASLEHELLPRYVEHFEEDGALVLVMERIEGESLAVLRKKGFRAGPADVERLLSDASRALSYLHGLAPPVVHRDLKPANVIRRPDGSFAFVDFGAVRDRLKLAGGSTVVGTFGYMAPEQFQGRASAASDVYGIGATALALLTNTEPEDLPHKGLAIDVPKAVPKTTPPWLVRTLEAMLEPDPDARASSVEEALARGARGGDVGRGKPAPTPGKREGQAVPFPARVAAWVGLLVARLAVWLALGVIVPALLMVLSLVFGASLRRAAAATRRAGARAASAIGRSARKVTGEAEQAEQAEQADAAAPAPARVRVKDDPLRFVRAVTPEQAQREAGLREASDAEAWAERRATEEAERWEPPRAWVFEDEAREAARRAKRRP